MGIYESQIGYFSIIDFKCFLSSGRNNMKKKRESHMSTWYFNCREYTWERIKEEEEEKKKNNSNNEKTWAYLDGWIYTLAEYLKF